jgi:hypothetical protein
MRVHQRGGRGDAGHSGARPHGGSQAVSAGLGARPGHAAGAADPDALARSLALLLDGGLADGALAADPAAPAAAKETARQLVGAAVAPAA